MEAIRKDINAKINVRKMSDEEIDNSDSQHYCDDESGSIYKEEELKFLKS